jgi:hypothetical protein
MKNIALILAAVVVVLVAGLLSWNRWLPEPLEAPPTDGPLKHAQQRKNCYLESDEEYAVLETSISYLYKKSLWNMGKTDESIPFVVLLGFTDDFYGNAPSLAETNLGLKKRFEEDHLSLNILEDYKTKNKAVLIITKPLNISKQYKLMTQEEFKQIFRSEVNSWNLFYEKYPRTNGFISFTRPGIFNKDACIYGEISAGWTAGLGMFLILSKEKDGWVVVKEMPLWVS